MFSLSLILNYLSWLHWAAIINSHLGGPALLGARPTMRRLFGFVIPLENYCAAWAATWRHQIYLINRKSVALKQGPLLLRAAPEDRGDTDARLSIDTEPCRPEVLSFNSSLREGCVSNESYWCFYWYVNTRRKEIVWYTVLCKSQKIKVEWTGVSITTNWLNVLKDTEKAGLLTSAKDLADAKQCQPQINSPLRGNEQNQAPEWVSLGLLGL